jgi:hypothetical protein
MSKMKNPIVAGALTVAAAVAILVFPVPYSRQRGFDVTITRGGQVAHLHLPGRDRVKAEARAQKLARGGTVAIAPHVERVWGPVYAMAEEKLLHIDIDMNGKTDAQVEGEISSQLSAQGWNADSVEVQRGDDGTSVQISAQSQAGDRTIKIVSQSQGGPGSEHLDIQGLEIEGHANMSDAELKQKILDQLKARGMTGDVSVENGQVRVRATKTVDN